MYSQDSYWPIVTTGCIFSGEYVPVFGSGERQSKFTANYIETLKLYVNSFENIPSKESVQEILEAYKHVSKEISDTRVEIQKNRNTIIEHESLKLEAERMRGEIALTSESLDDVFIPEELSRNAFLAEAADVKGKPVVKIHQNVIKGFCFKRKAVSTLDIEMHDDKLAKRFAVKMNRIIAERDEMNSPTFNPRRKFTAMAEVSGERVGLLQ